MALPRIFAILLIGGLILTSSVMAGTAACEGPWVTYTTLDSLPATDVQALAQDEAGRIWAGTLAGGAARFDGTDWTVVAASNSGLADDAIVALAADGQMMWFGHFAAGVSRSDGLAWDHWTTADGLTANLVSALAAPGDGTVWVGHRPLGTQGAGGGYSVLADGVWSGSVQVGALPSNLVTDIVVDEQGVWFAVGDLATSGGLLAGGVARLDEGGWTSYTVDNGLVASDVQALAIDAAGTVWAGSGAGLSRFDGSGWQTVAAGEGLIATGTRTLATDADGGLWVGTANGVSYLREGVWQTVDGAELLAGLEVRDILVAANGEVWFASEGGVMRLGGGFQAPVMSNAVFLPVFNR
jgi:ligand-binding sensor domain-containing protein